MPTRLIFKSLLRDPRPVAAGLFSFAAFVLITIFLGEWWGVIFGWAMLALAVGWVSRRLYKVRKEIENDPFDGRD